MKSWDYRSDDNVIYLSASRRGGLSKKKVFYLHHPENYWTDLNQIPHFDLYDISCREKLYVFSEMVQPDLVLFDKEVDWINPIEAIEWVSSQFGVPVILLASKR